MTIMKKNFSRTAFRYTFEFMLAGFVGWLYEVAVVWIMWGYVYNRGMLHMPIVPIYAIGAFILLFIFGRKKHSPLFVFTISTVVTTVFELGASYLLDFLFGRHFWTYEGWYFSILDRASLVSSVIFGLFALLYIFVVHPLSGKLSEKLPEWACIVFAAVTSVAVITDFIISFIKWR